MDRTNLLVFGDQAVDIRSFLRSVLGCCKSSVLVDSFVARASATLRDEVSRLSSLERESIPNFSTLQELVDRTLTEQHANAAVDGALLCIAQIIHYICFVEQDADNVIDPQNTCIVGLCTGLLAATAIASSPSPATLIPLAIEIVRIAFRTGLYVDKIARCLYQRRDAQESWCLLLQENSETEATNILKSFHNDKGIPASSQAYVSAIGSSAITLSGPPSTMRLLSEHSSSLQKSRRLHVPIYGPYHAVHLHSEAPVEDILSTNNRIVSQIIDHYSPKIPVYSTSSGSCTTAHNTRELLKGNLREILCECLRFDRIIDGCVESASAHTGRPYRIIPFGPVNVTNSIMTALKLRAEVDASILSKLESLPETNGPECNSPKSLRDSKIAIVGMAGRFPGAADHEKFWDLLEQGLDVHREVPPDRFDPKTHCDPTGKKKNTSHTPYGCFIDEPGLFDPRFFNMSPREALQTCPMQRLSLVTAYEALEMSGYVPNRTPSTKLDRVGTFYGQTSDDWREINAAQDVDTYFITGGVRAFGPGRINYHFKFSGPSYSVDTACSSGMAAVQIACTSLWAGECDTAIAGGVSVMTNSDIFSGLSRGQFLSKVGPCQTFDNDADGYCRADGIGTVILKRLQDAEADKDNVLGVILGSATNHSADAISITHPHAETQERLYTKILNEAGVDALDIDYVEMHGTGTQAGDGTEMRSVTNVFAPRSRKRSSKQSLYLGAVKANVGHGEAASGVTALIKCLLILQKNSIPPHVGIKKMINQSFPKDLDERNVHIALKNTPWKSATEGTRRMYVSNFSAAGGNTGLLMEDGPRKVLGRLDPRTASIIAISAKSKSSLKRNLERLVSYIDVNPSVDLQSLAYTLTARRIHHNYRTAFAATDLTDARTGLALSLDSNITPISGSSPRVAFVFTGQGSHYPAIAKELFDEMSQFRLDLLSFDSICYSQGFPSFLPLIDGTITDVGSLPPTVTQLGLCCIQMALARLFRSWGVKPNVVMGHSLGEYAALNVAGVVSVSDTIYLVGKRAQCLQKACTIGTHTMLAVRAPKSTLSELPESLQAKIQVACINGPQATVYSGLVDDIKSAADHFESIGIKSTKLDVPYAFHSSQVDPILSSFEEIASSITYNKAEMTIVSPLWGNVIPAGASIDATYLRRHAREPVNFVGGLLTSQGAGYVDEKTAWVEIGPQPTCLGMVKSAFGPEITTAPSLRKGESAWKTLANCLSLLHTQGATIDWNEYHRDFVDSIHLLDLPKYAFDNKNYWIQYTNDWCLTKTDVPSARILQVEEKHHLSTTTVQEVVSESIVNGKATVVVESDLCRADLRAAVSGHLVNGAGLCPSSIYADMALTVADHMYKLLKPNKSNIDMNVCHMEVTKPLILKKSGTEKQILRLTATTDGDLKEASLTYSSGEGATRIEHAKCVVEYGDGAAWLNEWTRNAYLIKGRIDGLQKAAGDGKAHRILQGMAYKLFEALVQYSKPFRGMQEVIMDSDQLEATAHVKFQTTEADGNFFCSPFWIDSVAHLSGFIVNATDAMDSKNQVYVSHGWESMRIAKQLSASKSYRSYVRMQPTEGKMVAGDVYVFEGETIIAMVGGLKFQCIPRTVLDTLLPPAGGTRAAMVKQEQKATVTKSTSGASGQLVTTETQVTKTVTATRPTISVTATVLGILADEIGIDIDELADPHAFADLGVDSLMSLSISGRMREELELDVNSTLFNDYPTIGQLKGFLAKFESQTGFVDTPVSGISTPDLDSQTDTSEDDGPDSPPSGNSSMVNILPNSASSASMDLQVVETTLNKQVSSKEELIRDSISTRQATSVLLQGNSRKSSVNLFIFPDGGGSATSYVGIPDLSTKVAVYGLNSPFMKVPEEYDCGVRGITLMMLKEVRRRQPHGPYVFAGWSAGGVVAFEATQQMIAAGESVEKLILLDSPCPLIIEPLPPMLHQFFHQIGLLGDGLRHESKIPPWLLPHFAASVTALNQYRATKIDKIDPAKAPQTIAIWCTDGVCKNPDDPKPDPYPYGHAQWLLENRTDFGPNLWDTFIPNEKITTLTVPGNHFTMMRDPNVSKLGDAMRNALFQ